MALDLVKLVKRKKRIGRGISGRGAKSGRGMKGQRARAGAPRNRAGFEGGQTPLYMRLPKGKGMKQKFASQVKKPAAVSTKSLNRFQDEAKVGLVEFIAMGLAPRQARAVKLIGNDPVEIKLNLRVQAATEGAKQAVEKAGGTVEVV